jgi:hypothetical protein
MEFVSSFWVNFTHNLFKPLLLFFYAGFLIPIFKIKFEFPVALYQVLTMYLLIAIGWHGGEELAIISPDQFSTIWGMMAVGFCVNLLIGIMAYNILRRATNLRQVDAATVGAYYGSDSAGTFVTAVGVMTAAHLAFAPFMPVMLAVMEIPGCLLALYLATTLRKSGMDAAGNMPSEPGYTKPAYLPEESAPATALNLFPGMATAGAEENALGSTVMGFTAQPSSMQATAEGITGIGANLRKKLPNFSIDSKLLHEVFLSPGIYLLFAGIVIGFISRLQGADVVKADDELLVKLFQGTLCLFLLEMGITASKKLADLKKVGWQFIAFALCMPVFFGTFGITALCIYSHLAQVTIEVGTYALFAALCSSASYIAMPAVQRIAIPEASATLPLAASLGVTFSFNVTLGIPLYIEIAKKMMTSFPL